MFRDVNKDAYNTSVNEIDKSGICKSMNEFEDFIR